MDHRQLTDEQFVLQFKETSLPPSWFNHEAHLRLAYVTLRRHGLEKAIELICQQIQAFDKKHGDGTKFHKTLTVASIYAVHHFMLQNHSRDFDGFLQSAPQLLSNLRSLILSHYSLDILNSDKARFHYLEPDLSPFTI